MAYKNFEYWCDGGCIMLGNEYSRIHLPNDYGDGTHKVSVRKKGSTIPKNYRWCGMIEGEEINVYDCDLPPIADVVCTLKGSYAIHRYNGNIILEEI